MKPSTVFPRLTNNEVVEIKGERYRAEFWSDRTYEFFYLGENGLCGFKKTEQEVSDAIKIKTIKSVEH